MTTRWAAGALGLMLLGITLQAAAQLQGYRWVDDQGNVHYVGRRDQVPEQYRGQLPAEGPAEPPKPVLPAPPGARTAATPDLSECVLRFRGTAARKSASRSYPSCEACRKALATLSGEEATRAECIAASVKSYR
ncbi:MAG TPA: hypothetical protein VHT71_00210 [Methylomirabilota bacterium]|jgi:hypothetical protein|nr:hypothetical protein [Methylomirabilota bacterium]